MTHPEDLYALLGILPDAEPIVVTAAYRALAARYHSDRWDGPRETAHERMADINRAYAVLGDPAARTAYDHVRGEARGTFEEPREDETKAFTEALLAAEQRWTIAVGVFPHLASIRQRLAKTSHQLAFSFVTVMLETKRFREAEQVAASIERSFLERYFGTNERILAFASELVSAGLSDAAKALNQLVEVLGSDVDPDPIILKVAREHNVVLRRKVQMLKSSFLADPYYGTAIDLAVALGLKVSERGGGFFGPIRFEVRRKDSPSPIARLNSTEELVEWVRRHLVEERP